MKVRSDILRTYQVLHSWTGIVAGLVLFIGFFAGALTMFQSDITYWATPKSEHLAQVPIENLDLLLGKAQAADEKLADGFIIDFQQGHSPLRWYQQSGGRGLRLDDQLRYASLDENDQLITTTSEKNQLGTLIDQLHRTAGIVGNVGHEQLGVLILGVAAVLYGLAIVSGVIFLLPTLVKSFFALRKEKGSSRFWLDSHNLIGMVSLPFHFIIAWTVVVFAFHDVLYGGLSVVYGDKPLFERMAVAEKPYQSSQLASIATYIDRAKTLAPDYQLKQLEFSRLSSKSPSLAIQVTKDGQLMRGADSEYIYLNPYTMEISYSTVYPNEHNAYGPIVSSFFSLHFGNFAGDFGRWVYFVLGLLGAVLFYTGNLLWLEKRRKKSGQQLKSYRVMAALTVGVCLGSITGVASALLVSKWSYLANIEINQAYVSCYYLVFFASIAYCFIRGAARAAIHLQLLLTAVLALIPLTSLVLAVVNIELWQGQLLGHYGVDLLAGVFAIAFYLAAGKTRKRALNGDSNSIWSLDNGSVKFA